MLQHAWDLPSSSDTSWEIPNNMAGLDKVVPKTKKNVQSKFIVQSSFVSFSF